MVENFDDIDEMLQWGHVQMNVEIIHDYDELKAAGVLQWGHVQMNVEILLRYNGNLKLDMASMGPRSNERGNSRSDW